MTVVRTVSCHLAGVRFAWFGLCLRSRGRALLRCVWDGVRCLLDWVLCRGTVSGSLGSIADLRLWVVVYIVISLAFHQVVFPGIRVSYWLFIMLLFLDLGYLTIHCFNSSVQYCLIIIFCV